MNTGNSQSQLTDSQNSNSKLTRSEGLNAIEQEIARIQQKYPHMRDFEMQNTKEPSPQQKEIAIKQDEIRSQPDISKQLVSEKAESVLRQESAPHDQSHNSTPGFTENSAKIASRNQGLSGVNVPERPALPIRPQSSTSNLDMPRQINPKDLTNEELEYVIKTGKVPPKYLKQYQTQSLTSATTLSNATGTPRQTLAPKMSPSNSITQLNELKGQLSDRRSSAMKSPEKEMMAELAAIPVKDYPKNQVSLLPQEMTLERTGQSEQSNIEGFALRRGLTNEGMYGQGNQMRTVGTLGSNNHSKTGSADLVSQITYGLPYQTISDTLSPISTQKTADTGRFNMVHHEYQPAQKPEPSHSRVVPSLPLHQSRNDQKAAIAPYQCSEESQSQGTLQTNASLFPQTRAEHQGVTQSMTDALRALQQKVEKLEHEKQTLQVDMQKLRNQNNHEQASKADRQQQEKIKFLQLQVETAEADKMRHLEENSSERLAFQSQITKVKEENRQLHGQIQQMASRFEEMERTVSNLTWKEQEKRQQLEFELKTSDEERISLQEKVAQMGQKHNKFKQQLQEKVNLLRNEVAIKQQEYNSNQKRTLAHNEELQRENKRLRNEVAMLRKEIGLKAAPDASSLLDDIPTNLDIEPKLTGRSRQSVERQNSGQRQRKLTKSTPKTKSSSGMQSYQEQNRPPQATGNRQHFQSKRLSIEGGPISDRQSTNSSRINNQKKERPTSPLRTNHKDVLEHRKNASSSKRQEFQRPSSAQGKLSNSKPKLKQANSEAKLMSVNTSKSFTSKAQSFSREQPTYQTIATRPGKTAQSHSQSTKPPVAYQQAYQSAQPGVSRESKRQQQYQKSRSSLKNASSDDLMGEQSNLQLQIQELRDCNDLRLEMVDQIENLNSNREIFRTHPNKIEGNQLLKQGPRSVTNKTSKPQSAQLNTKLQSFSGGQQKQFLENEIFVLEREISDCNLRYKQLLKKKDKPAHDDHLIMSSPERRDLSEQVHQLMQQLEEKTSLLYRLKKERQALLEQECKIDTSPTMIRNFI